MKKLLLIFVVVFIVFTASCGNGNKTKVEVLIPFQNTEISMLKILYENEQVDSEKYSVNYSIAAGAQVVQNALVSLSSPDIAIAPLNVISNLYKNNVGYKIAAATMWGSFYIATTNDEIKGFSDMQGKTICVQGQPGGTHEVMLKYLIEKAGFEWTDEVSDNLTVASNKIGIKFSGQESVAQWMIKPVNTAEIGFFPEPALTTAKGIVGEALDVCLDIQALWTQYREYESGFLGYPQAGVAVKGSFYNNHKEFVDLFLEKVRESIDFVLDDVNLDEAAQMLTELNVRNDGAFASGVSADVFKKSKGNYGMNFVLAKDCFEDIKNYLQTVDKAVKDDGLFIK